MTAHMVDHAFPDFPALSYAVCLLLPIACLHTIARFVSDIAAIITIPLEPPFHQSSSSNALPLPFLQVFPLPTATIYPRSSQPRPNIRCSCHARSDGRAASHEGEIAGGINLLVA